MIMVCGMCISISSILSEAKKWGSHLLFLVLIKIKYFHKGISIFWMFYVVVLYLSFNLVYCGPLFSNLSSQTTQPKMATAMKGETSLFHRFCTNSNFSARCCKHQPKTYETTFHTMKINFVPFHCLPYFCGWVAWAQSQGPSKNCALVGRLTQQSTISQKLTWIN